MLKWCKDLRIGEGVKKADKIRRKLNHGKIVPGVYLITFSENPRNLLEIIREVYDATGDFRIEEYWKNR